MDIIKQSARKRKWKSALALSASVVAIAISASILYAAIDEVNTKKENEHGVR